MMIRKMIAAAAGLLALTGMQAPVSPPQPQVPLQLWRLDCGEITINQYGAFFSDTFQYPEGPMEVVGSCYLIRNGDRYFLWDTGLTDELVGRPFSNAAQSLRLNRSLVDQLGQIGVRPEQIEQIGISHWHFDHSGQAGRFPQARLLMGRGDVGLLRSPNPPDADAARALAHWLTGGGTIQELTGDHDVFGDGRVMMLTTRGHTPGHYALLVRLESGPVLLSGDIYHFREQVENRGVPPFNHDRADSLASMDRYDRIARNLGARSIIQHDPRDIQLLPVFPEAAQ